MELQDLINEQLATVDLSGLNQMAVLAEKEGTIFNKFTASEIIGSILTGNPIFTMEEVIQSLKTIFMSEIFGSVALGAQLVIICIIIGLLKNLSNSFGQDTVSALGTMISGCIVIALCLNSVFDIYTLCANTVATMTITMQILLPILVPLLIAMGGISSGGVLNPIIVAAITIFNTIIQRVILPAVLLSCIFFLVNSLTERDYVKKLANFMRTFAIFMVGFCVTIFTGLTTIQGLLTKTADGVLAKTARYSIDNFVPIVGGFAADSMDMILTCSTIIKNGIGIFGLLILITIMAFPLVKILAVALIYKITAIIIEPIGDKSMSDCINDMGNSVITMAVVLFLTTIMFLIFLSVIIGIGGGRLWG